MRRTRALNALATLVATAFAALVMAPASLAEPAPQTAASSAGSIGIQLVDAPQALADNPRAQNYIIDNVPPGQSITRHVLVSNKSAGPLDIEVYAGAAQIRDGVFSVDEGHTGNALTSWITIDKPELQLDAGAQDTVEVTIAVPADAPETEQYAAIWASHTTPPADGNGVAHASRVGVRVYLSVGEGNGPPADFDITGLTPQRGPDGTAQVAANVTNTGGRAVDLSGDMDLTDGPGGLTANTVSAQTVTIAPGGDGTVVFAVPDSASFPAGPWHADVTLQSGYAKHHLAADVTFPDKGTGDTVSSSDANSLSTGVIITIAVIVVIVVLLLIGAIVAMIRRRRSLAAAPTDDANSGYTGDADGPGSDPTQTPEQ